MENSPIIKKPVAVTISCALLFSAGLFAIAYTFTGAFATYGRFYPAANVLLMIIMFAALSGVWSMEKWGVWIFLVALILKLALDSWVKAVGWWELLFILPLVVFLSYVGRMK